MQPLNCDYCGAFKLHLMFAEIFKFCINPVSEEEVRKYSFPALTARTLAL
jgi:hypothetical protein